MVILGSTGSIGTQAIDVIDARPQQFNVVGLSAGGSSPDLLTEQVRAMRPDVVAVADSTGPAELRARVPGVEVWDGPDASTRLAAFEKADVVLNAITGAAGLEPTLATLGAGITLALGEGGQPLVIGGRLVMDAAAPGQIVAVDSGNIRPSRRHYGPARSPRCAGDPDCVRRPFPRS